MKILNELLMGDSNYVRVFKSADNTLSFDIENSASGDFYIRMGYDPDNYGHGFKYVGTGSGDANYLQIYSENLGSPITHLQFHHQSRQIDVGSDFIPMLNDTYDLGSTSYRFCDVNAKRLMLNGEDSCLYIRGTNVLACDGTSTYLKANGGSINFQSPSGNSVGAISTDGYLTVESGYRMDGTTFYVKPTSCGSYSYPRGTGIFYEDRYLNSFGWFMFNKNLLWMADKRYTISINDDTGMSGEHQLWYSDNDDHFVSLDMSSVADPLIITVTDFSWTTTSAGSIRPFLVWHGGAGYSNVQFEILDDTDTWTVVDTELNYSGSYLIGETLSSAGIGSNYPYKGYRLTLSNKTATTGYKYIYASGLFAPRGESFPWLVKSRTPTFYGSLAPYKDSMINIGSASNRFSVVYADNVDIQNGALQMNNANITGVNNISINDTGNDEGISWDGGYKIDIPTTSQGGVNAFRMVTANSFPFQWYHGSTYIGGLDTSGCLTAKNSIHTKGGTSGGGLPHFYMRNTDGTSRVNMGLDAEESGSNSGSNFSMWSYADDGSYLLKMLTVVRSTGKMNLYHGLYVDGNIDVSGTVDGVDIASFKTSYDSHNHNDLYYTKSEVDSRDTTVGNACHGLSSLLPYGDTSMVTPDDDGVGNLVFCNAGADTTKWILKVNRLYGTTEIAFKNTFDDLFAISTWSADGNTAVSWDFRIAPTINGTSISLSNHNHSGVYEPVISSKGTAFNKDFGGTGTATTVARSDHTHDGSQSSTQICRRYLTSDTEYSEHTETKIDWGSESFDSESSSGSWDDTNNGFICQYDGYYRISAQLNISNYFVPEVILRIKNGSTTISERRVGTTAGQLYGDFSDFTASGTCSHPEYAIDNYWSHRASIAVGQYAQYDFVAPMRIDTFLHTGYTQSSSNKFKIQHWDADSEEWVDNTTDITPITNSTGNSGNVALDESVVTEKVRVVSTAGTCIIGEIRFFDDDNRGQAILGVQSVTIDDIISCDESDIIYVYVEPAYDIIVEGGSNKSFASIQCC